MHNKNLILICLLCACIGALLYAYAKGLIILRSPTATLAATMEPASTTGNKKKVTLHYWHQDAWKHETTDLIWSTNTPENIEFLITSWLTLLDEEAIMHKRVAVQSVMISGNIAFISFDRTPLSKEASLFESWMLIEGLLKTMRDNGIQTQGVRFLVQHQQLGDAHLDFSKEWPIAGFLEQ